jgi:hypothetical protein
MASFHREISIPTRRARPYLRQVCYATELRLLRRQQNSILNKPLLRLPQGMDFAT